MIAALYVATDGVYFNDSRIDPYDINRNALNYKGKNKVIAHPPCQRWGRYWGGGPMLAGTSRQLLKGNDENAFAHSLWNVRTFGGVIEHPEASHAWSWFGLERPNFNGGWTKPDSFGGRSCCVAQGHYGHRAQKMTWLYGVGIDFKELKWGRCLGMQKIEEGYHSKKERNLSESKPAKRISKNDRIATPLEFKELLIELVSSTGAEFL